MFSQNFAPASTPDTPSDAPDSALAAAFDAYYESLYRYAYVHLRDREAAEDIAALAFHRLLDSRQSGRPPTGNLRAWLYQVTRNLIVDHTRRQRHRAHAPLTEAIAIAADTEADVDQLLRAERAHEAILRLNERQREVIILRFLQGLDVDDVAAILKVSTGAVKTLQHRALDNLRRMLGTNS